MKFTVNTKPLKDVLDLVIVPSNISKFYAKSTVLQVSVNANGDLRLNSEADSVSSEGIVKGSVDALADVVMFVDALLFKQLISSVNATMVQLDFDENSINITAGKSRLSVPNVLSADMRLASPSEPSGEECDLKADIWKKVKDKQMYALTDSFVKLMYSYIYNGPSEIMVSSYNDGLYTYSENIGLPATCLISPNIVSLILNVGAESKLFKNEDSFILVSKTDAYTFVSEFKPKYESNPEIGSYCADIIKGLYSDADIDGILIPLDQVNNLLSQVSLLSDGDDPTVDWSTSESSVKIFTDNVEGKIDGKLTGNAKEYAIKFKVKALTSVISHLDGENIAIYPSFREGRAVGCVFKDDDVSVILAGVKSSGV